MSTHYRIYAVYPNGKRLEVRYAENWRQVRAMLRQQRVERPTCAFNVRRIKPEPRWILRAYSYAFLKSMDRNDQRIAQGRPCKFDR